MQAPIDHIVSLPIKFIIFKQSEVIPLFLEQSTGFYRDSNGGLYALRDKSSSVDDKDVCGLGLFTLPNWDYFKPVNEACSVHDYTYESPVYQAFHTRDEADDVLQNLLTLKHYPITAGIFSEIARLLGAPRWENAETR